jgi:hypothetical protein
VRFDVPGLVTNSNGSRFDAGLLHCRNALARGDDEAVRAAEKSMVLELLKAQFGNASVDTTTNEIVVTIPSNRVVIDWENDKVTTNPVDQALKARVETCMDRMRSALARIDPGDSSNFETQSVVKM